MVSYSEWSKKLNCPELKDMTKEERRLLDIARNLHKAARRLEYQVHGMYNARIWEAGAEERARLADEQFANEPLIYSARGVKAAMEAFESKLRPE